MLRLLGLIFIVLIFISIMATGGLGLIGGLVGGLFGLLAGVFGAFVGVAAGLFGAVVGVVAVVFGVLLPLAIPILIIVGLVSVVRAF